MPQDEVLISGHVASDVVPSGDVCFDPLWTASEDAPECPLGASAAWRSRVLSAAVSSVAPEQRNKRVEVTDLQSWASSK